MKIEKSFIKGIPHRKLNAVNMVVAHEAGNPKNTGKDSLDNEVKYMKNNWNKGAKAWVSHWVGGGGRIIQLAPTGIKQNGAGGKANRTTYAHVELARTDNKETFKKDYAAYVWLLRTLAKEAGLPVTLDTNSLKGIKSHDWVRRNLGGTTHTDPYGYLASFGISKEQFKKDIEKGMGQVNVSHETVKDDNKSLEKVAKEVIQGKYGNEPQRSKKLKSDGYDPKAVQKEVNRILKGKPKKSINTVAKEVIQGKYGNGNERIKKIRSEGYDPKVVQREVNKLLK